MPSACPVVVFLAVTLLAWGSSAFGGTMLPSERQRAHASTTIVDRKARTIHVIVLVHGPWGSPLEMKYLQDALERHTSTVVENDEYFLIHSAACNHGRTYDGIAEGGLRLADEINELLQRQVNDITPAIITLSLVGNSLGGLYARYSLPYIHVSVPLESDSVRSPDHEAVQVIRKVFCTTATPHLGLQSLSYFSQTPWLSSLVRVPRWVERVVATLLGRTGLDLFRFTSVIADLACRELFASPLEKHFHTRIAYANAYTTDFQVPLATAAFLQEQEKPRHSSLGTHRFVSQMAIPSSGRPEPARDASTEMDSRVAASKPREIFMASFETTTVDDTSHHIDNVRLRSAKDRQNQALSQNELAQCLDDMGWTKVLCDVRDVIPLSLEFALPSAISSFWFNSSAAGNLQSQSETEQQSTSLRPDSCAADDPSREFEGSCHPEPSLPASQWQRDATYPSSRILLHFRGDGTGTGERRAVATRVRGLTSKWYVPMGHTLLVANAKDSVNARMNAPGRPIMDHLASNLIHAILSRKN
jgi:Putative serine esterase (DUF676)